MYCVRALAELATPSDSVVLIVRATTFAVAVLCVDTVLVINEAAVVDPASLGIVDKMLK
jgi:hypothetical protein